MFVCCNVTVMGLTPIGAHFRQHVEYIKENSSCTKLLTIGFADYRDVLNLSNVGFLFFFCDLNTASEDQLVPVY